MAILMVSKSGIPLSGAAIAIRLLALGMAVTGLSTLAAESAAQTTVSREYTIKAAYLYNFGRYVRWPDSCFPDEHSPFVIGVLGTDPFGSVLDTIARAKRVDDRRIVARRFATLDQYTPSHILFVARSTDPKEEVKTIRQLRGSHVLLVGETPGFAQRGGVINLSIRANRVRLEINQQAARREQLKISSKLLSLARLVEENSGQ